MEKTRIQHISALEGQTTQFQGWIYNARTSGKIAFLEFRDGSGEVQIIAEKSSLSDEVWNRITRLTIETSVIVTGKVAKHPKRDLFEVHLENIEIIQLAAEYPIGKKEHGPDFLLDNRHLWIRSPRQAAILRVRSEIIFLLHEFYQKQGFYLTNTPTFTPNSCEGTTDLFEVEYFDRKVYLTQNGQLYLEALAAALGRVYDLNPNFRAEKSKTRRHLTEFWSINPEIAFCEQAEGLRFQEETFKFLCKGILERCAKELQMLERDTKTLENTTQGNFPRLKHREAVSMLKKLGSDIKEADDLGADDEEILTRQFDRPIFITHYPKHIKPFYMAEDPNDPGYALNNDMLAPEGYGEIIGGGQRVPDYQTLTKRIEEAKLDMTEFAWYLDLRKFGSVPHYGYGIGIERTVRWICGLHHVRESIPFPRMLNRVTP